MHNVITSFTAEGYRTYGKDFIESFLDCWPKDVRLTVYYEGEEKDFPFTPGMSWKPIEEVEFLPDFMSSLRFPIFHGLVGDQYDINFDARMGRKTFMQVHTARQYGGKVFWIDADVITHTKVPTGFLDKMLPDDKFSCYLGRDGWYFTESGFLGFNAKHDISNAFFHRYLNFFITGLIFTQQWWHDCIAYDCTRLLAFKEGLEPAFVNLAAGLPKGTMHPFVNSALGAYMDHRKGARKGGRSKREDLVVNRTEPYWLNLAA